MMMTTQTVTALKLTAERPEMVRSIIELIVSDTTATLLEAEDNYNHLYSLLIQSGQQDIVENYKQATASIFLFDEYRQLLPLVDQLIDNIGSDLFCDMWDADENSACSEILRCFGHGVSFWDNHKYQDFGFSEIPKLKRTFENPQDIASQILDKIAEVHTLEIEEDTADFDTWLAENYEHSGGEYYLSKNPNDYLMYELHTLKEQWEEENNIQELEGDEASKLTTWDIPARYLSLVFKKDANRLTEEDIKQWEDFTTVQGLEEGHWSYSPVYEPFPYFSFSNDVDSLVGDILHLQWSKTENN